MSVTKLRVIQCDSTEELETKTNEFVENDKVVYAVVNMRVYPPSDHVKLWTNYIIYKEAYKDL